ncbi:hypothetical protein ACGFIU_09325 [Rhodococcus oryzae]|uniref:hypothetical protein n=1 Tax=Rhodococcus oryzae TaxID=2571143 RepID=UPI00371BB69D
MLGDDTGRVRGRVTHIQVVTERFHRTPGTHGWEILRGHRRVRDVDAAPRFFDREAMLKQDGGAADHDVGVLVTLDLDDLPDLTTRPSIVPGAVSAAGALLWVIDRELPLLVSIDADRRAHEHILPGAIGHSRRIWATSTGCWVADPTGLFRCDNDGGPLKVDDLPVTAAAVLGESLFACHDSGRWTLHRPDCDPIEIESPDGRILLCTSDSDSVAVALSDEDGTRFARIDQTGAVTLGPVLPPLSRAHRRFLGGNPLRLLADDLAVQVEPDLTLGAKHRLPTDFLSAGQVGPYLWGVHHPPDESARNGGFPLPVPNTHAGARRQFWMLTLLDGATLETVSSTPVYTTQPTVTIDGAGTVWLTADGVRSIPTISMQWPPVLDVAALLDDAATPQS